MPRAPYPLDRSTIRRRFARAAAGFDGVSFLHREVAKRMGERLEYIRTAPDSLLDLGCGTGADLNALGERYPQARRIAIDSALPMLAKASERTAWFRRLLPFGGSRPPLPICADATALPLAANSQGLVWSNLMLQWLHDPLPAFKEMQRVLKPEGLLMFTTLGPDTLRELRDAFGDDSPHVHRFIDMHDLGDMLVSAGFAEPVMDMETLTLTYKDAKDCFAELRHSGAANAAQERRRGLTGRHAWTTALARLEKHVQDGRLPATFEIIYGHAWKSQPKKLDDGRAIIQFAQKRPPGL